jgi:hypothetical protein
MTRSKFARLEIYRYIIDVWPIGIAQNSFETALEVEIMDLTFSEHGQKLHAESYNYNFVFKWDNEFGITGLWNEEDEE